MSFFYNILRKIKREETAKKIKIFVFFAGFLFIFFNFVFFVGKNAINVPFWDQWGVVDILTRKASLWELFRFQHNEHRIGVGLIIIASLAKISHWSQILEIKFISFLIISSSLIILYLKYIFNKKIEILDLFIPLVFLNIFQFENIDWGFQIPFVLPLFFFCLWLAAMKIKDATKRNVILTVLSLFSAYSSFHGLILPIFTIGYIVFDSIKRKQEKLKNILAFILLNMLTIGSFFINYRKDFQTDIASGISWQNVRYFSLALSNGFFYSLDNPFANYFLALIVLLFLLFGIFKVTTKEKISPNFLIGVILIFFSLAFISIITIGRSAIGTEQALTSRYVTFTMLIPVGLFFIFSEMKKGICVKIILLLFIIYNIFFLSSSTRKYAQAVTIGKQKALECYTNSSPDDYSNCFKIFKLYPDEEFINSLIPKFLEIRGIIKK